MMDHLAWQHVESSSALQRVRYNPETRKLQVQFHGKDDEPGKVAEYDDVSAAKFSAFMAAESKGQHFHRHFRTNKAHDWRYV